jgi:hypothetical protein
LGCVEQAVCGYAVDLDGPGDPPILVHCDRPGEVWHPEHESFSQFVAVMSAQCTRPRRDEEC